MLDADHHSRRLGVLDREVEQRIKQARDRVGALVAEGVERHRRADRGIAGEGDRLVEDVELRVVGGQHRDVAAGEAVAQVVDGGNNIGMLDLALGAREHDIGRQNAIEGVRLTLAVAAPAR